MWRTLSLLIVAGLAIFGLYSWLGNSGPTTRQLTQEDLFALIKAGHVRSIVNAPEPSSGNRYLIGWYELPAADEASTATNATPKLVPYRVAVDLQFDPHLLDEQREAGYTRPIETFYDSNIVWPLVMNFLPIILFVGLMYFLFRQQIRMARARAASTPPAPPSQ